jgi:UDP-glucuronate 4-epimerase
MHRDFTYIDDIIRGITHVLYKPAISNENWDANHPDSGSSLAPFRIYNIGHSSPVNLLDFIREIEQASNKKAIIDFKPLQPGDVKTTWADVNDLKSEFNYSPSTTIEFGIEKFLEWYKEFYQIK